MYESLISKLLCLYGYFGIGFHDCDPVILRRALEILQNNNKVRQMQWLYKCLCFKNTYLWICFLMILFEFVQCRILRGAIPDEDGVKFL